MKNSKIEMVVQATFLVFGSVLFYVGFPTIGRPLAIVSGSLMGGTIYTTFIQKWLPLDLGTEDGTLSSISNAVLESFLGVAITTYIFIGGKPAATLVAGIVTLPAVFYGYLYFAETKHIVAQFCVVFVGLFMSMGLILIVLRSISRGNSMAVWGIVLFLLPLVVLVSLAEWKG